MSFGLLMNPSELARWSSGPFDAPFRLLAHHSATPAVTARMTASATPTPMPALAPVDSPWLDAEDVADWLLVLEDDDASEDPDADADDASVTSELWYSICIKATETYKVDIVTSVELSVLINGTVWYERSTLVPDEHCTVS